jgi:2-isopropylmalate synthase
MARERIYIYDTTLRDGQQTPGIDFSVEDKKAIVILLEELGVDYVEGGYPGANPTDTAFFKKRQTSRAKFAAFGMTKRAGVSASNDPGLTALLQASSDAVCFVAKSWDYHVRIALGCTNEENLESITASVTAVRMAGREALVDCEHFFDGYKANPEYALSCAKAAYEAGARWVVLCDTNGGTQPSEVAEIINAVKAVVPGESLGIHAHNDTEQAVAVSLAAIDAGVRHVQGTLNGIGERCGNANLVSLIPTLALKPYWADRFELGVKPEDPQTYEHVPPETVGNRRRVMVSDQGGKSNFIAELERRGIRVAKDDVRLDTLIALVKEREAEGYAYEGADASFELLARAMLNPQPEFFKVDSFRCLVERRFDANGSLKTVSEAVVKVEVDSEMHMSVAEGHGPVNALDIALRKDLGRYQDEIEDLELVDFKVRILNGGTAAITRVLIESGDATGARWRTVGVSDNIIDASFQALMDSVNYKLMKNRSLAGLVAAE